MNIGEAIKKLRLHLGLKQEAVCGKANITQGFYSSIENGAIPSIETLSNLAQAFNVPLFFIIIMATEKRDIPKQYRNLCKKLLSSLDAIIEEVTTKHNDT